MEDKNLKNEDNNLIEKAVDNTTEVVGNIADKAENIVGNVIDGTKKVVDGTADVVGDLAEGVIGTSQKVVEGAAETVVNVTGAVADGTKKVVEGAADVVTGTVSSVAEGGKKLVSGAVDVVGDVAEGGSSILKKLLPLLLLLVLGVLAFILFQKGCNKAEDMAGAATDVIDSAASNTMDVASTMLDSASQSVVDGWKSLGDLMALDLPNGTKLNVPANGFENSFVQYLQAKDESKIKETWFNFDRILFDNGQTTLNAASNNQLDGIAEVLKAFPTTNLKIGGYTDNTGDINVNKKISLDRANSVKTYLESKGIEQGRLTTEGYGPEHPLCNEDTEECRAKNRRVGLRVEKF